MKFFTKQREIDSLREEIKLLRDAFWEVKETSQLRVGIPAWGSYFCTGYDERPVVTAIEAIKEICKHLNLEIAVDKPTGQRVTLKPTTPETT